MKLLTWKVTVKVNGKKVDHILCTDERDAHRTILNVVGNGLYVYSDNIKTVQFSISKVGK